MEDIEDIRQDNGIVWQSGRGCEGKLLVQEYKQLSMQWTDGWSRITTILG